MPDATAFGTQVGGVTQTTTTTQTTYNTNPGFQTFGATTFPTTQTTFGTTEGIPVTQGFTMQNEYQATGQTTPDSNIGYGTTPAEFAAAQANYTTTDTLQTTAWDELRKKYKLKINDSDVKKNYEKTLKDATKKEDTKEESKTEESKEENKEENSSNETKEAE